DVLDDESDEAIVNVYDESANLFHSKKKARGYEPVLGMTWEEFKALLMEESCPSNEMEKLEIKFWNHTMVGANHAAYIDQFHELAKLVLHLVTLELKRIVPLNSMK
nr:reverse transcriptase domain-containing protein [Tanacetum cinerariifolium]